MDERERDGGRGARGKPERKLLDHVDCFPSQSKWTYRLETSVLDVKIPVAAPVSKPPLYSPSYHSFSLSLIPSTFCLSFICTDACARVRARPFPRVSVNDAMGVDTVQQIRNPLFLDIKLRSLFLVSTLRTTRLRAAATLCEQSIGATDKTEL